MKKPTRRNIKNACQGIFFLLIALASDNLTGLLNIYHFGGMSQEAWNWSTWFWHWKHILRSI